MKPPDHVIPFVVTDDLRPKTGPAHPALPDFDLDVGDREAAPQAAAARAPTAPTGPQAPSLRAPSRPFVVTTRRPERSFPAGRLLALAIVVVGAIALYDLWATKRAATAFDDAARAVLLTPWDTLSAEAVTGRVQTLCKDQGAQCRDLRAWVRPLDADTALRDHPALKDRKGLHRNIRGVPVLYEAGFQVTVRTAGPVLASTTATLQKTEIVSLPPAKVTAGEVARR